MIVRTYTETYDINTSLNELNIFAIHTPQAGALKKMFKGHFINFRRYKILSCDINLACAQQLPLSPELVGLEAGQVDPRDVMNPMLFKACTGENLNILLNQIYNISEEVQSGSSVGQHINTQSNALKSYYQLLADGSFRKAHPQQGLRIRNLKPFVHRVVTTQTFKNLGINSIITDLPNITQGLPGTVGGFGGPRGTASSTIGDTTPNASMFLTNGVSSMPWFDTAVPTEKDYTTGESVGKVVGHWLIQSVPRVYCGCLIMPPAETTKFYMRMAIRWKIAFKDYRPAYELGTMDSVDIIDSDNGINGDSGNSGYYTTYWNLYHDASTKDAMEKEGGETFHEESSFTTNGADSVDMVSAQPY